MAGDAVVDAAGGGALLHRRVIRRERAHGGRAVPAGKALAAGMSPESAGTLADEEVSDGIGRTNGSMVQTMLGRYCSPTLEDLGVVPIRCGERLRDGRAEHRVFAGGAPVVEENVAEGVTGLFNIDGEIGLADGRRQFGVIEE